MNPWSNKFTSKACRALFLGVLGNNGRFECADLGSYLMDDITKSWNKLSLSNREGDEFIFQAHHKSQEFMIVAKFFTPRALNVDTVAHTFNPIWRAKNGSRFKTLVITGYCSSLIIKEMSIGFYAMNHEALINTLLYSNSTINPSRCET